MSNHRNPAFSLAMRHQNYFLLTFNTKDFNSIKFDFKNITENIELLGELPDSNLTIPLFSSQRPFKLNKKVLRKIKHTNRWILIEQFYKSVSIKNIYCWIQNPTLNHNKMLAFLRDFFEKRKLKLN